MGNTILLDNGKAEYRNYEPSESPSSNLNPEQIYYGNIAKVARMKQMNKINPQTYTEEDIDNEIRKMAEKYEHTPEDYDAEVDLYLESQEISNTPSEPRK